MVEKLTSLGYDGADIHYLYRFFGLHKVMVFDPRSFDTEQIHRNKMREKMEALIAGEDAILIEEIISLSRSGMDYELLNVLPR